MERDRAKEILEACKVEGKMTKAETFGQRTKIEVYLLDGWEYTFFYNYGEVKKIEAYNHRELIEQYVK